VNENPSPEGGSLDLPVQAGKLARNTAYNLLGYGLPLAFGLLTLPLIIRGFGKEKFGVISLIWVVLGYFGFLDLGLGRATIRFVADAMGRQRPEEVPEYLWTPVLIQFATSLLGTALLAGLTPLLVGRILNIPAALQVEARTAFYLTALSFPIVMITASFRGVLEAAQRFDLMNAVKIPASTANYVVMLASLLVWRSLVGIVVFLMMARVLTLIAYVVLSLRIFPLLRRRPVFVKARVRPLLSYGGWATVTSLGGSSIENLDRFAIGALVSMKAVANYVTPYEAVGRLGILPGSLVTTLFPNFSLLKGRQADSQIRTLFARAAKIMTAVSGTAAVLIIILAHLILRLWLGRDFAQESGLVLQLIAASFIFLSFNQVVFSLLQGVGRPDLPAYIHLVLLGLYLPILGAGIKLGGIQGAAAAWLVQLGLQALLLFLAARRIGLTDIRSLMEAGVGRALAGTAVFAAAGGLLSLALPSYAAAALASAAFAPLLWLWVLNGDERRWLKGLRRQRRGPGEART